MDDSHSLHNDHPMARRASARRAMTLFELIGVVFIIATFAFGFQGLDMCYYLANAVAVLLVTMVLNAREKTAEPVGLAHA